MESPMVCVCVASRFGCFNRRGKSRGIRCGQSTNDRSAHSRCQCLFLSGSYLCNRNILCNGGLNEWNRTVSCRLVRVRARSEPGGTR